MAKAPKHADAALEATSRLSSSQLQDLCRKAAEETRGSILRGGLHQVNLEQENEAALRFVIRNRVGPIQHMTFEVAFARADGGQHVSTQISDYKSFSAGRIGPLGAIGVGPKQIRGLHTYREFMQRFGAMVREADSSAAVTIRD